MEASEVYSIDNVLLYRFDRENRLNVTFDSIPKHVVEALIASEDSRFYEHSGVDLKSLMRVMVKTVILGDESAGGGKIGRASCRERGWRRGGEEAVKRYEGR